VQNTTLDMVTLNIRGNTWFLIKIDLRAPSAKQNTGYGNIEYTGEHLVLNQD
jgi:hypothetical protein